MTATAAQIATSIEVEKFVAVLFEPDERVELRCISSNGAPPV